MELIPFRARILKAKRARIAERQLTTKLLKLCTYFVRSLSYLRGIVIAFLITPVCCHSSLLRTSK